MDANNTQIDESVRDAHRKNAIALNHIHAREFSTAANVLNPLFDHLNALPQTPSVEQAKAATAGNLANSLSELGNPERVLQLLQVQLEVSERTAEKQGMSNALNSLGIYYTKKGDLDKAIEFFERRLSVANELNDLKGKGNTLNNLGTAYISKLDPEKAIKLFIERIALAQRISDRRGEASGFVNLGNAYVHTGDHGKARANLQRAAALLAELHDPRLQQVESLLETLPPETRKWTAESENITWKCEVTDDGLVVLLGETKSPSLSVMTFMADRDEFLGGKLQQRILDLMGREVLDEVIQSVKGLQPAVANNTPSTDPMENTLKPAMLSFAAGRYNDCIAGILSNLPLGISHELAQLLFISAERANRPDVARVYGPRVLAAFADRAWQYELLKSTLHLADVSKLVQKATNPTESCQAHFYIGLDLARKGRITEANQAFAACVESSAMCLEFALAQIESKRLAT